MSWHDVAVVGVYVALTLVAMAVAGLLLDISLRRIVRAIPKEVTPHGRFSLVAIVLCAFVALTVILHSPIVRFLTKYDHNYSTNQLVWGVVVVVVFDILLIAYLDGPHLRGGSGTGSE